MTLRLLSDVVLVAHLCFIVLAAIGGLLALRWRWAPLAQLPAVAWGAYIELTGGVCPLTPLENALRRAAGDMGYSGGFIEHYLAPVIYPAALSAGAQLRLAVGLVLLNVAVYAFVLWRRCWLE
jgi:hypothetical protein